MPLATRLSAIVLCAPAIACGDAAVVRGSAPVVRGLHGV
jgi:hypothetical protein